MYLELLISNPPNPTLRSQVKIRVVLNAAETTKVEEEGCLHIRCKTPLPVMIYGFEDPQIKATPPTAYNDGTPFKAYYLPKAPRVGLARLIHKKTVLQLPTKGEIWLGYINPKEIPLLKSWWKIAQEEFTNDTIEKTQAHKTPVILPPQGNGQQGGNYQTVGGSQNVPISKSTPETKPTLSNRRGITIID